MKRYIVFAGSAFYPEGGWHDITGFSDSLKEAVSMGVSAFDMRNNKEFNWWHVVDTDVVRKGGDHIVASGKTESTRL